MVKLVRRGRRWRVRMGSNVATVDTLGDAKRVGEAMAQQMLAWRRETARLWVGEPLPDRARQQYHAPLN